jgi:hypothetical protein
MSRELALRIMMTSFCSWPEHLSGMGCTSYYAKSILRGNGLLNNES